MSVHHHDLVNEMWPTSIGHGFGSLVEKRLLGIWSHLLCRFIAHIFASERLLLANRSILEPFGYPASAMIAALCLNGNKLM